MALGGGQEIAQEEIRLHAGLNLLKYCALNHLRQDCGCLEVLLRE
jgi:hypothetical protein